MLGEDQMGRLKRMIFVFIFGNVTGFVFGAGVTLLAWKVLG
jgi:hypothetical protein